MIDGITNKSLLISVLEKYHMGIAANPLTKKVYVANMLSNTISIIDKLADKIIANVIVDENTAGLAVNPTANKIYITNMQSHTISIISSSKNKVTTTIIVNPSLSGLYRVHDPILRMPLSVRFLLIASLIAVNYIANMIYVTDTASDTVSMADGKLDGVVEKTNFDINPPNSGGIQCNGQQILQSY